MGRIHRFIPEKRAIAIAITGSLDEPALRIGVSQMLQDPRYDPQVRILVDLRAVSRYAVSIDAVDWLIARQPLPGKARKGYIVSSGFGQGLTSLIEQQSTPGKVRIFWELEEAQAWINAGYPAEQALTAEDLPLEEPVSEPNR